MQPAYIAALESWGDTFPPACGCGCGEPVSLYRWSGGVGTPAAYVNRAHASWARTKEDYERQGAGVSAARRRIHQERGDIPIEDFRAAVRRIKGQRQLTWVKLAEAGGVSPSQLNMWMFGKGRDWVTREATTLFLRRLAGLGTPATKHERRTVPMKVGKTSAAIKKIGVDPPKPSYVAPDWAMYDGKAYGETVKGRRRKEQRAAVRSASVAQSG